MSAAGGAGAASDDGPDWSQLTETASAAAAAYENPLRDPDKYPTLMAYARGKAFLNTGVRMPGDPKPPGYIGPAWTNYVLIPWGDATQRMCVAEAIANALQVPLVLPYDLANILHHDSVVRAGRAAQRYAISLVEATTGKLEFSPYEHQQFRAYLDLPTKLSETVDVKASAATRIRLAHAIEMYLALPTPPTLEAARSKSTSSMFEDDETARRLGIPLYHHILMPTHLLSRVRNKFWQEFYAEHPRFGLSNDEIDAVLAAIGVKYKFAPGVSPLRIEIARAFYRRWKGDSERAAGFRRVPPQPYLICLEFTNYATGDVWRHLTALTEGMYMDVQSRIREPFTPPDALYEHLRGEVEYALARKLPEPNFSAPGATLLGDFVDDYILDLLTTKANRLLNRVDVVGVWWLQPDAAKSS